MEWLYHIGVPTDQIEELAEHSANTVPVMMPYIDAFFMPRAMGDRPDIVPEGAVNFAFLGQFAQGAAGLFEFQVKRHRSEFHHRFISPGGSVAGAKRD